MQFSASRSYEFSFFAITIELFELNIIIIQTFKVQFPNTGKTVANRSNVHAQVSKAFGTLCLMFAYRSLSSSATFKANLPAF